MLTNVAPFGCNQNEASDDVAGRDESTGGANHHRTSIALRRQSQRLSQTRRSATTDRQKKSPLRRSSRSHQVHHAGYLKVNYDP
jgi:hypothetical protein